jgi:hypothetical protein
MAGTTPDKSEWGSRGAGFSSAGAMEDLHETGLRINPGWQGRPAKAGWRDVFMGGGGAMEDCGRLRTVVEANCAT